MSCIEDTIESLRKKYEQKYGFAIFDLNFKERENKIIITGSVLTENQKEDVVSSVSKACNKKVENKIKILSEVSSKESGWAIVKVEVTELKSRFVDNALMNEKILSRIRASQAIKNEILRVLLEKDNQLLVQASDLTMGWVSRRDVILKKTSMRKFWRKGRVAEPGKLIAAKVSGKDAIHNAEKYLGFKYVLGANKLEKEIDCSGLTQCVYKNVFDIILPRHSWDQKKVGKLISLEKAQDGDLVFMINKKTGTRHVGIIEIMENGQNIIHASAVENKVVRQSAEKVFESYELVEVRRVIK